jgi:hypothetical protein
MSSMTVRPVRRRRVAPDQVYGALLELSVMRRQVRELREEMTELEEARLLLRLHLAEALALRLIDQFDQIRPVTLH